MSNIKAILKSITSVVSVAALVIIPIATLLAIVAPSVVRVLFQIPTNIYYKSLILITIVFILLFFAYQVDAGRQTWYSEAGGRQWPNKKALTYWSSNGGLGRTTPAETTCTRYAGRKA